MKVRRLIYGVLAILSIWIVILLVLQVRSFRKTESFESGASVGTTMSASVQFLRKEETAMFLKQDEDGYVHSLSKADLSARKVRSHEEYLRNIFLSASEVSKEEEPILRQAIQRVDERLATYQGKGINAQKLRALPWRIAVTQGDVYEDGYPHTRQDIIFINPRLIADPELASTLLHEKVHIYQRTYGDEVDAWLAQKGYTKWKLQTAVPLSRSNPDLNHWIYLDPVSKKPMLAEYTSQTPTSISDVSLSNPAFEHPYEYMAYEIAKILPSNP